MKAASLADLKKELQHHSQKELVDLCLRLGRFKKDNKELITYLIFDAHDEAAYVQAIKAEINEQFTSINSDNLYWAKKSLRKIVRVATKQARYSGNPQTMVEILLHFCATLNRCGIAYQESPVLVNLYNGQLKKINKLIAAMEEDLQYDYLKLVKAL